MASLSPDPTGIEFEDLIAAHLATRGMFVETGVTERDPKDILELDIVWTDYRTLEAPRHAMEVKSGKWHIGEDYFKYLGWVTYLGLASASFVYRKLADQATTHELLERLGKRTKIKPVYVPDPAKIDEQMDALGLPKPVAPKMTEVWRFSFWAQHRLYFSLSRAIAEGLCPKVGKMAKDAWKLYNDAVFFEPDIQARMAMLLREHIDKRYMASAAAEEIEKKEPNAAVKSDSNTFRAALFHGAHIPVQACLYVSHRGRLAAIKAAVDYALAKNAGKLEKQFLEVFGVEYDVSELEMHAAFKNALKYLETHKSAPRYAVFWQVFMWVWGGFILIDKKNEEYVALAEETGVPPDEIDTALGFFDVLFPRIGGAKWFVTNPNDKCYGLALMPPVIRGIGAYSRLVRYGVDDYSKLSLTGHYSATNLAKDHNAVVRLLSKDGSELLK